MADLEIRKNFQNNEISKYKTDKNSIIINELGLNHGENRADIAILDSCFIGFEIKSDKDSLIRLKKQVRSYDSVFNKSYIIVGVRYSSIIDKYVPKHWGIIFSEKNNSTITFNLSREPEENNNVNPISLARLLWKTEVLQILESKVSSKLLRQPKKELYKIFIEIYKDKEEIQEIVLKFLKSRINWRYHE